MTIEKGIPIPPKQFRVGKWTNLIRSMQNADSFIVDTENELKTALSAAKRIGVKAISRKIDGEGFRIWRIE